MPYKIDVTAFSKMAVYKTMLQNNILALLTEQEIEDIRESVKNESVITKLISLASLMYRKEPNKTTLYCLSMAVGTILKEYEWGMHFIHPEGLLDIANKITLNYQQIR